MFVSTSKLVHVKIKYSFKLKFFFKKEQCINYDIYNVFEFLNNTNIYKKKKKNELIWSESHL